MAAEFPVDLFVGVIVGNFCANCGLITCICELKKTHKPECRFIKASQLLVEIACSHGFQACPQCDPCDCGIGEVNGVT